MNAPFAFLALCAQLLVSFRTITYRRCSRAFRFLQKNCDHNFLFRFFYAVSPNIWQATASERPFTCINHCLTTHGRYLTSPQPCIYQSRSDKHISSPNKLWALCGKGIVLSRARTGDLLPSSNTVARITFSSWSTTCSRF